MKRILCGLAAVFSVAQANAGVTCVNSFGTTVKADMAGKKLKLAFSHPNYKKASLNYTGEYRSQYYFIASPDSRAKAIVDVSVFNTGKGAINYCKPSGKNGCTYRKFKCG